MSLKALKELQPGNSFEGFVIIRDLEWRTTRNGDGYALLQLGDRSGRMKAYLWDINTAQLAHLQPGRVIKVQAILQIIKGRSALKILRWRERGPEDDFAIDSLHPRCRVDIDQLPARLKSHISQISNPFLLQLLNSIFDDPVLAAAYLRAPCGKLWHHNYIGGLAEHSLTLLDLADVLGKSYTHLDMNLLKTGIICHEIGSVNEFAFNGFIDKSDDGRLLGHIFMGGELLAGKISRIKSFPDNLKRRILHLILSHRGEHSGDSTIVPLTLEAAVLQQLSQLSAAANAWTRIVEQDRIPGSPWTKYIPLLERLVYVGEKPGQEKREHQQI